MKIVNTARLWASVGGLCTALISASAAAEYRLTAIAEATAYAALLSGDVARASEQFELASSSDMDFAALNNLCVKEVLARELDSALASCEAALDKLDLGAGLAIRGERAARAAILSNRAVAAALQGDVETALVDVERALALNGADRNARINRAELLRSESLISLAAD